jgi:hypothetical protein
VIRISHGALLPHCRHALLDTTLVCSVEVWHEVDAGVLFDPLNGLDLLVEVERRGYFLFSITNAIASRVPLRLPTTILKKCVGTATPFPMLWKSMRPSAVAGLSSLGS